MQQGGEKYERALGIIKIKIQHAKLIKGKRKDKGREDVRLFEKKPIQGWGIYKGWPIYKKKARQVENLALGMIFKIQSHHRSNQSMHWENYF